MGAVTCWLLLYGLPREVTFRSPNLLFQVLEAGADEDGALLAAEDLADVEHQVHVADGLGLGFRAEPVLALGADVVGPALEGHGDAQVEGLLPGRPDHVGGAEVHFSLHDAVVVLLPAATYAQVPEAVGDLEPELDPEQAEFLVGGEGVVGGVEVEAGGEVDLAHGAEAQVGLGDLADVEVAPVDAVDLGVARHVGLGLAGGVVGRVAVGGPQHVHVEEVGAVVPAVDAAEFGAVLHFTADDAGILEVVAGTW